MVLPTSKTIAWFAALVLCTIATGIPAPASERKLADIIVVVGASGTDEYGDQFSNWADTWKKVAEQSNLSIATIGIEADESAPDRKRLQDAIEKASQQVETPLWLVMIGHGTYANNVAKFNMKGRDVSATELASWLEPVKRPVVVIGCHSASGPLINRLSGPNRVIVTATKSGSEQNYSRFGQFFAEAITSADADLDHDDEVSIQEAFLRASSDVQAFYDSEARISTEHALLDDNGDAKGTPAKMFRGTRPIAKAKGNAALDGKTAAKFTLSPSQGGLLLTADEVKLRSDIESRLDQLRSQKESMDRDPYYTALESLMLEMANLYRKAEQRSEAQTEPQADVPAT